MSNPGLSPEKEAETRAAFEQAGGNISAAARILDIPYPTMRSRCQRLKLSARDLTKAGLDRVLVAPDKIVPGFGVSQITSFYNGDGTTTGQWVQQKPEAAEREQAFLALIEAMLEPIKGLAPLVPMPAHDCTDELVVIPVGDQHHGLYADAKETGDDYDCKISTRLLTSAVDNIASRVRPAKTALLLNLGDFTHANDRTNATPGHGNLLDVDTRYEDVMESGAMALIRCVLRLLERHEKVIVWCMPGNHDPDAYFAIALSIKFYFHNEPRVVVDMTRGLYKYLRFGKNLIASHHGHGAKAADLPLIMAADRREDWGATEFRVFHCGHVHHKSIKEYPGCTVETHRTLAGKDAWHAGKGYRSGRDIEAITYHREYGEIERIRCDVAMLEAA